MQTLNNGTRKRALLDAQPSGNVTKKAALDVANSLQALTQAALGSQPVVGANAQTSLSPPKVETSNSNSKPLPSPSAVAVANAGSSATANMRGPGERQRGPRHWNKEEDLLLKEAVARFGAKQWKRIALHVPGRTHTQCLQRWNKVLRPGLKKGPWTKQEDEKLSTLVTEQAAGGNAFASATDISSAVDWSFVASQIPGRSIKQCRERWSYNLSPDVKKGCWTALEDNILLLTQKEVGNRWAKIARLLPGRTEHTVKTRYRSIMRAKRREWKPEEDMLLMKLHRQLGSQWAEIAEQLPGRTKNAVNTRFKVLAQRTWEEKVNPTVQAAKAETTPALPHTVETPVPETPVLPMLPGKLDLLSTQNFLQTSIMKSLDPTLWRSHALSQFVPTATFPMNLPIMPQNTLGVALW